METKGQSRKWDCEAKEKGAGKHDSAPHLLATSPTASLFSLCEHRDKGWIHGLLKSPGGPFSSSHQLLSIHSAHFLKAYSPGTGKVGVPRLPQAQSQGSQPNGAWQAPGHSHGHQLPPTGMHVKAGGKDVKANLWLWPTQRILPLVICTLEQF